MSPRALVVVVLVAFLVGGCAESPLAPLPEIPDPDGPGTPNPATPLPVLTLTRVAESDSQIGVAGYPLDRRLQVQVQASGVPVAGVRILWLTSGGSIQVQSAVTDVAGIASANWILGSTPGVMFTTAVASGRESNTVTYRANAIEETVTEVISTSNYQVGPVGQRLPSSILARVTTRFGVPKVGVPVYWTVAGGTIMETSLTNAEGIAAAEWTLPTQSGNQSGLVRAPGNRGTGRPFQALALPGPFAEAVVADGNGQGLPPYWDHYRPLIATARDAYGNRLPRIPVTWSVEQGPVRLVSSKVETDGQGWSEASVAVVGVGGPAVVSATFPNQQVVRFNLGVQAATADVYLSTERWAFVSGRNRSSPAIDTVDAGTTVRWQLTEFDYDDHQIVPVGPPAFIGQAFPYGSNTVVAITFPSPGTYQYINPAMGARGTLVVR